MLSAKISQINLKTMYSVCFCCFKLAVTRPYTSLIFQLFLAAKFSIISLGYILSMNLPFNAAKTFDNSIKFCLLNVYLISQPI